MKLFNKKKNSKDDVLTDYILNCLDSGKNIDFAKEMLENNKEKGNYTSEDVDNAIKIIKDRDNMILIQQQLKKIPRRERKMALKLLKDYEAGNILKIEKVGN